MITRDIVLIALFAALMAVLGAFPPLAVPLIPVPITAQSLGPMLAGGILGARRGALSMALFLLLVAIGLPLLSGGRGGLAVFAGPTVGYLFGWIAAAYVIGWLTERKWMRLGFPLAFFNCLVGGILVIYAIGVPVTTYVAGIPLWTSLAGSAPFIPGDVVKAVIAALVIVTLKRTYPLVEARS
ncbi:biotin synthase, putative [Fulvimarina pelagi HTCC2506]|uniref:Biotin transporter n=2 Tax=Fulvimarina pelagi TaxID=217511 RepID=Q0FYB2_9HYPH|nr:biotin transporter BioY [Fulvimarina pelagi]EAU40083.1 biotin synthase, putative [Fulvimarina pelagi HTCC2506]BAT31122.1 BioY family protein [Fulvimarina pelagi]